MRKNLRKNNKIPISLFSFLDILGGTIGILTLIIAIFMIQMSVNDVVVDIVSIPGSLEDKKNSSYIVCNGNGEVTVYHKKITTQTTINSTLIDNLLNELKSQKEHLIIAVRPNSFQDFKSLRNRVENFNISAGYQPIDKDWQIKFPK